VSIDGLSRVIAVEPVEVECNLFVNAINEDTDVYIIVSIASGTYSQYGFCRDGSLPCVGSEKLRLP